MLNQAYEKLQMGAEILATGGGRINERLATAFKVALYDVPAEALPAEARKRWDRVWKRVTAIEDPINGPFAASVGKMKEDEAAQIAQEIVAVDAMVRRALDLK